MAIKVLPAFLILAFVWTSCQNDAPQSGAATTEGTTTEGAATIATPGSDAAAPGSDAAVPAAPVSGDVAAAPAPATGAAPAGAGKVNPPHGQPGHQCGIPVGAPLDGSAAKTQPAATTQPAGTLTPVTAAPKPAAAPAGGTTTVAPGTNPPHGQPGHQCGIPVGAPLDGKAKQ